jgi:hypothetical protein
LAFHELLYRPRRISRTPRGDRDWLVKENEKFGAKDHKQGIRKLSEQVVQIIPDVLILLNQQFVWVNAIPVPNVTCYGLFVSIKFIADINGDGDPAAPCLPGVASAVDDKLDVTSADRLELDAEVALQHVF